MVGHTASFVLLETSSPILTRCKMRGRAVFMSDTAFGERDVLPLQPSSFLIWAERYLLHYAAGRRADLDLAREKGLAPIMDGGPPLLSTLSGWSPLVRSAVANWISSTAAPLAVAAVTPSVCSRRKRQALPRGRAAALDHGAGEGGFGAAAMPAAG